MEVLTQESEAAEYGRRLMALPPERRRVLTLRIRQEWLPALDALPDDASDSEVAAALAAAGHSPYLRCHGCDAQGGPLVRCGEPYGCDSRTADICVDCLSGALAALEAAP